MKKGKYLRTVKCQGDFCRIFDEESIYSTEEDSERMVIVK
jgi:hypothetical protein